MLIISLLLCYSLEKNTIAGVLLFDETLQVQSGVRHTGTTHGVKISNQERYSCIVDGILCCLRVGD